jgi:hypothetical protein
MILFSASRFLIIGVVIGVIGAMVKERILRSLEPVPLVPRLLYDPTPFAYAVVPLTCEACR